MVYAQIDTEQFLKNCEIRVSHVISQCMKALACVREYGAGR